MAKVNKALFWSLFAAGGTVTAFVFPVLILIVLMAAHGSPPEIMGFEQIHGILGNWLGVIASDPVWNTAVSSGRCEAISSKDVSLSATPFRYNR